MSKKPIIVFEGIEGSGKSYHLTSVARYLKQKKLALLKYANLAAVKIQRKLGDLC